MSNLKIYPFENAKSHNYDIAMMGNGYFKFQPDRMNGLAARIINFFDLGSFLYIIF